jgi:hypothetical protein
MSVRVYEGLNKVYVSYIEGVCITYSVCVYIHQIASNIQLIIYLCHAQCCVSVMHMVQVVYIVYHTYSI